MDKKMTSDVALEYDILARDVAFEIVLGGDRLSPADVREKVKLLDVDSFSLFLHRVEYHAQDFTSHDDFVRSVTEGGWFRDQMTSAQGISLDPASFPKDRGKWFVNPGGVYEKCDRAAAWAKWGVSFEGRRVEALEVAKARADALLDAHGREICDDFFWDEAEILSRYGLPEGHSVSVRRDVNRVGGEDLSAGDHHYYVVVSTPEGRVTEALLEKEPGELDRFIDMVDHEMEYRKALQQSAAPAQEAEFIQGDSCPELSFSTPMKMHHELDGNDYLVNSVFIPPFGSLMLDAVNEKSGAKVCIPLSALSDRELDTVRKCTEFALGLIRNNFLEMEKAPAVKPEPRRKASSSPTL